MKGVLTAAHAATALALAASTAQRPAWRPSGPVANVYVTPSVHTVDAGASASFFAALRRANGNILAGRAVSWTVSVSSVARIEGAFGQTVLVRAVGAGFALVTASSEGKSGSGSVLVR